MKGYLNMPDDTRTILEDGWLHTGDIVKMDEEGYFYVVDRKKDMILSGGYNVYPREIEEVFFENPKVQEAAVIGIPHPKRGEAAKAFVVLKQGEEATPDEMIHYCKDKLAKYKHPTEVEFRKELPKSKVGKVLKQKLREEEAKKIHEGRSSIFIKKVKNFPKKSQNRMHHDFFAFINSMRKRRKLLQGAKYHVMARANRREMKE